MNKQGGVTLIEMMIVVLLFGLLALAGASFTNSWGHSNRVLDGSNLILQGFNRARAAALRNEQGVVKEQPAAALCLSSDAMMVRAVDSDGNLPNCAGATGEILWQIPISPLLQFTAGGNSLTCACFNNKAYLTSESCTGCLSPGSAGSVVVQSGDEDVTVNVF